MSDETKALTWYLAYGSNMNRPSLRVVAGQHGLPPGYLRYLLRFELAADERLSERQRS